MHDISQPYKCVRFKEIPLLRNQGKQFQLVYSSLTMTKQVEKLSGEVEFDFESRNSVRNKSASIRLPIEVVVVVRDCSSKCIINHCSLTEFIN